MGGLTIDELRELAERRLASSNSAEGHPLDALERSLIRVAVASSVTSLNGRAIEQAVHEALEAGASTAQVQEIVSLVSGLGVHSLMTTTTVIANAAKARGDALPLELSERQERLWQKFVGEDAYWRTFRQAMPNFLEVLIRLSPDQFEAFFIYCAVPWRDGCVRARTKELAAIACDATPAHRFLPGFLLHLENAIAIGVGRRAVFDALDLAADAPLHVGIR